jgi:hypothetical protein
MFHSYSARCLLALCIFFTFAPFLRAETVVTLTDEVLVKDMPRLGVHASGDNYFDSANRKNRVLENFEGTITRFIARFTPGTTSPTNIVTPEHTISPEMAQTLIDNGATYTIVAGPDIWKTGNVTNIEILDPAASRTSIRLTLDSNFTPDSKQNGIMVHAFDPRGFVTYSKIENPIGSQVVPNAAFVIGDVSMITTDGAPAFGTNSLRLNGTSSVASYLFFTHYKDIASPNGTWRARFQLKKQSGSPILTVRPKEVAGQNRTVTPGNNWEQHEVSFTVNATPENTQTSVLFEVTGGAALVDDVQIWKEGDTNPTAFRDEHVNVLKFLKPGVVRYLVNRADKIENRIGSPLESYSHRTFATMSKIEWGMQEFFELADHVGFAPWYTLPGTLTPADMTFLMEYLAGPATTPGGQRRAALGRQAPWTDSLDRIFCQFGNEWITFSGTGFNGKGYWEALIQAAKASPYYNERIFFVTDSQGGAAWNLDNAPSSDVLCHGGYMNYGIYQSMLAPYDTPEKLARFVLTIPWQQWTTPNGSLANVEAAIARGVEPSVYEGGNFHTTFGNAPLATINDIVSSHVGGMAATQNMLLLQKLYGCRYQNSFAYSQKSFSPGGSFGDIQGNVLLWGGLLSQRADSLRFRPRFLQLAAANRAIGGDLVQTIQSGSDQAVTFSVTGKYSPSYANRLEANLVDATIDLKPIVSYGYREGSRRGLILVNQDTTAARSVRINFPEQADGAASWWRVAPSDPFADNENTAIAPQVALEEGNYAGFASGHLVSVPASGLLTLSWEVVEIPSVPTISTTSLPTGTVGTPYSATFAAIDGNAPLRWTITGLPAFLTFNAANQTISGTPPISGSFPVTITVADADGDSDSETFPLVIQSVTPPGEGWIEANGLVVMEAENADTPQNGDTVNWTATTEGETTFMDTGYRAATTAVAAWTTAAEMRFPVTITTPGTYSISARRRAVDGWVDSGFLGLNGTQVGANQFTGLATVFTWTPGVSLGNLTAGEHVIVIRRRESGLQIDRVALALNGSGLPSGTVVGPAESAIGGEPVAEPSGYPRWQLIHFNAIQLANAAVAGPLADPLGDGLSNKLKFALGRGAWERFTPVEPSTPLPDGRKTFVYRRNLAAGAPIPLLEVSTSLAIWDSAPAAYEKTILSTAGDIETIQVAPPSSYTGGTWFVRVAVP